MDEAALARFRLLPPERQRELLLWQRAAIADSLGRRKKGFNYGGFGLSDYFNQAEFILPLNDLGAGAVNTQPSRAVGVATFTRAAARWTKLASGLWASVATGVARSCYTGMNTAVGLYSGYLPELGVTQLTPTADIRDLTTAAWPVVTMTVAKTATGIDGVTNSATTLTATGAAATILHVFVAAASSRLVQAWIRRKTGTGTVKLFQGASKSADFASSINSSTYTLCSFNASVDVTLLGYGIEIGTDTDAIEVDFVNFFAGSVPQSPMDAAAAYPSDSLTYALAGNISNTSGWAYAEVGNGGTVPVQGYVVGSTGSTSAALYQIITPACNFFDGTNVPSRTFTSGTIDKLASSWGGIVGVVAANGASTTGVFDGDMGLTTALAVGSGVTGGGNQLYRPMKNLRIALSTIPAAVLQAMTA